ncbi:hypothetical protein GGD63_001140 [Bradyrhizobium sp. cir1]|nr:hypothetical protein [Bradyrhizobium sp. cir1]
MPQIQSIEDKMLALCDPIVLGIRLRMGVMEATPHVT